MTFHHLNVIPYFEAFHCHPKLLWYGWENEFLSEWDWNDQMIAEWQVSQNSVFYLPLQNTTIPPHSAIPRPFENVRMTRNENHNGEISFKSHSSHFHFIPISFVIQEWWWNDEMTVKWGIFLKQGKTLNSELCIIPPLFYHSISMSYS